MSVGLEEAARRIGHTLEIPLAVDVDEEVIAVYKANLPNSLTQIGDVSTIFDGVISAPLTSVEEKVKKEVGRVDILLGGPPCQGHSDLNNHTRRKDPKNALYIRMARAAEVLEPSVVVIENVAQVELDQSNVVKTTSKALIQAGYQVAGRVIDLRRTGVPQRRRRFILLASKIQEIEPATVLQNLSAEMSDHPDRTVRWAIEDLIKRDPKTIYDIPSRTSEDNAKRIAYLFKNRLYNLPNSERPVCHRDGGHSYVSMYGRLRWDRPAQTITTGFGSMGQGRYVHPSRRRTITPHEAARLQTFPDWFDFGKLTSRRIMAKTIGNAVPPLLMVTLGTEIVRGLSTANNIDAQTHIRKYGSPAASSPEALHRMRVTRQRDTPGEVALRQILHARGLRFRVDKTILPGLRRRADIVFPRAKMAVFVDGCFWHSCPTHKTQPKANAKWWARKLAMNRQRDIDTNRQLRKGGWYVERIWEHETPAAAASRVIKLVHERLRRRPEHGQEAPSSPTAAGRRT
jgi:DNA (cytosine-5)-methyltransferase 1